MKLRPFLLADCATRLCRNRRFVYQSRKRTPKLQRGLKQSPEKFVQDAMNLAHSIQISDRCSMKKSLSTANYGNRAKFLLAIRVDCDKSGEHEMCSSVYLCFPRICFADICGCAAALSCQTRTATSRRGDCHRRRSGSKSAEKFSAYLIPIIPRAAVYRSAGGS
jgi:hypothetical protein